MRKVKDKKCKECKTPFTPQRPLQFVCSPKCAYENSKKVIKKVENQKWKVQKAKMKLKLKTLGDYEAEARKPFQVWIRQRDKNLPCISCGCKESSLWDAGHMFKAELYSGLIFNEANVHKQCGKCNRFLGGNEINYRMGLILRYGESYVKDLEAQKDILRVYKYTKEELIEIKNKYKELNKCNNYN